MIRVRCPSCGTRLRVDDLPTGTRIVCPVCDLFVPPPGSSGGSKHPRKRRSPHIGAIAGAILSILLVVGLFVGIAWRNQKAGPPSDYPNGIEEPSPRVVTHRPTEGPVVVLCEGWPFDAREAKRRQKETAEKLNAPVEIALQVGKDVTMKLVLIPAGKFVMGSADTDKFTRIGEKPQRLVTITRSFYMGATEVTQAQWEAIMGTEPWNGQKDAREGAENAASYVSWNDAVEYCKQLSLKAGRIVRLPTEAEWEYACRAGSAAKFWFGNDESKLGEHAWYYKNANDVEEDYAHPVRRKRPNAWGLYDMHGNVAEWCQDWYDKDYYSASNNTVDPAGPAVGKWLVPAGAPGKYRVSRGGCWIVWPDDCYSATRGAVAFDCRATGHGFRVACPVVDPRDRK